MTTFKSKYRKPVFIDSTTEGSLSIRVNVEGGLFDPADAPAIALAVMEAAQREKQNGDPASADHARHEAMNWLMTARDRAAKEAAAAEEAARGKRRDELVAELSDVERVGYASLRPNGIGRAAIDRSIDTENELAKERAK